MTEPVTSRSFIQQLPQHVREDEKFFYTYFKQKNIDRPHEEKSDDEVTRENDNSIIISQFNNYIIIQ